MRTTARSCWQRDEDSHRHESLAALGIGFGGGGSFVHALVECGLAKGARPGNHGLRRGGWVILTQDLDFGAILASTQGEKPSVIQIRSEDVSPEAAANVVIAALRRMSAELEQGALVTVDPRRTRLRYLPLRPPNI